MRMLARNMWKPCKKRFGSLKNGKKTIPSLPWKPHMLEPWLHVRNLHHTCTRICNFCRTQFGTGAVGLHMWSLRPHMQSRFICSLKFYCKAWAEFCNFKPQFYTFQDPKLFKNILNITYLTLNNNHKFKLKINSFIKEQILWKKL